MSWVQFTIDNFPLMEELHVYAKWELYGWEEIIEKYKKEIEDFKWFERENEEEMEDFYYITYEEMKDMPLEISQRFFESDENMYEDFDIERNFETIELIMRFTHWYCEWKRYKYLSNLFTNILLSEPYIPSEVAEWWNLITSCSIFLYILMKNEKELNVPKEEQLYFFIALFESKEDYDEIISQYVNSKIV